MLDERGVEEIIMNSLKTINEELDEEEKVEIGPESGLFGVGCPLDSLSLVSLIVDVEEEINARVKEPVALMDDMAVMREPSPFGSVKSLKEYIMELLNGGAPER